MKNGILRRKRILFAEDELSVRWATCLLLDMDEHRVIEASNGGEALDLYSRGEFDLVITDFQMPRMTGNELAEKIKTLSPEQPIIMITAYKERLHDAGIPVNATLAKPFTINDLRGAIADALSGDPDETKPCPHQSR